MAGNSALEKGRASRATVVYTTIEKNRMIGATIPELVRALAWGEAPIEEAVRRLHSERRIEMTLNERGGCAIYVARKFT